MREERQRLLREADAHSARFVAGWQKSLREGQREGTQTNDNSYECSNSERRNIGHRPC
jgi:hypothetical protein